MSGDNIQEVNLVPDNINLVAKAEIDIAIATAKKYPRSLERFRQYALTNVTLSESVAKECIYALPRDGKVIEGPSVRFAEVLVNNWGNCRAGARVVDESNDFITAQGVFHDMESNSMITFEVKRRIVDKYGKRYKMDMIGMTANAACSIALRNAVLKGVPKAFWADIYAAARKVVMGDVKTLENRRSDAIIAFQAYGLKPEQIFEIIGVRGKSDINLEHMVVLQGMFTALKDGDTTAEDLLGKAQSASAEKAPGQGAKSKLDQFSSKPTTDPKKEETKANSETGEIE